MKLQPKSEPLGFDADTMRFTEEVQSFFHIHPKAGE